MRKIKQLIKLLLGQNQAIFAFKVYKYNLLKKIVKWILPDEIWRFGEYGSGNWRKRGIVEYSSQFLVHKASEEGSLDRKFTMFQLMKLVKNVKGQTAECGAYQGASSYIICSCLGLGRIHHIFDSCEGVPTPVLCGEKQHWNKGDLCCPFEELKNNLVKFGNSIKYHIGWIPDTFHEPPIVGDCFAFVHIDVDLYSPTYDCLNFFYPRMSEGGIILLDDFGFKQCEGARLAAIQFMEDRSEEIIELTTGQAYIVKGS